MAEQKTNKVTRKTTSPMDKENVAVQLTKAIQTIGKQQESFKKSVEQFQELFNDVEVRIQTKQKELINLDEQFVREKKNRQIDLEQAIRQFGYNEAVRLLLEKKEKPIQIEEFEKLVRENEQMKAAHEKVIREVIANEREQSKKFLDQQINTTRLEFEMKQAKESAENKQLQQQITILNNTIVSLRSEIDAQRVLTKDVAAAQANANASRFASQQFNHSGNR